MKRWRAVWLWIWIAGVGFAQEEYLALTSTDGKTIEARIVAATETEVEIELRDGRRFTLPHTRFSLTTRDVIRGFLPGAQSGTLGQTEPTAPSAPVAPLFAFKDFSFRESETEHFRFLTLGGSARDVRGVAEKVYVMMTPRLAGLRSRFEDGEFRAPAEGRNPADFQQGDGRFRYTVHLISEPDAYQVMVKQYADHVESRALKEFLLGTAPQLGQFTDVKNRFSVALDDGETDMVGLVAHQIGFQLVSIETESRDLPLWLRMGAGYYAEHRIQSRCTVYYVDFTAYEENRYREDAGGGGVVDRREVISHEESWATAIQRLCRNGMPVGLARMLEVETGDLTPVESAFSLGLFAFCTSGSEEVKAFQEILKRVGRQEDATAEEFARLYGFDTVEAFDAAWRAYLLSRKFR